MNVRGRQSGVSLVELLTSLAVGALLLTAFQRFFSGAITVNDATLERIELNREARFAMARMVETVRDTNLLLLPQHDRSSTNWPENIREQTVPASAPIGDSTLATAVLAVAMPGDWDLDRDGIADADNDSDGRIDEDWPDDIHNDGEDGLLLIDDDGDGSVDESIFSSNDDEVTGFPNEDPVNGIDDDGDGSTDEDPPADMNNDNEPGIAGADDDGDGSIDEGDDRDDDEDGQSDEDWLDPVVFTVQGSSLIERRAVPWDTNGDSVVTGADYAESVLTENVTWLRVEVIGTGGGGKLVDLSLSLAAASGEEVTLNRRVRVGSSP